MFSTLLHPSIHSIIDNRRRGGENRDSKFKGRPVVCDFLLLCRVAHRLVDRKRFKWMFQSTTTAKDRRVGGSWRSICWRRTARHEGGEWCGGGNAVKVEWLPNQAWNVEIFEGSCLYFRSFRWSSSSSPCMSHSFMALSQHDSQTASRPALMAVELSCLTRIRRFNPLFNIRIKPNESALSQDEDCQSNTDRTHRRITIVNFDLLYWTKLVTPV